MSTLYLTRGLPASGKTTWARAMLNHSPVGSIVRLNRDDLRAMMLPTSYNRPRQEGEKAVTAVQQGQIVGFLRQGVHVIADDTNLQLRHARALAALAAKADADVEVVDDFLDVPLEECIRRDRGRLRPVGEQVIRHLHDRFLRGGRGLPPVEVPPAVVPKPYEPAPETPAAVIVDIDGTVALHGDRNPYDTSRYHEDLPHKNVRAAVLASANHYKVIYCSGRSEEFRDVTTAWLRQHYFPRGPLLMRPAGDIRNDAIVKIELFDQHIRDAYDVRWVFDDRDRVVEAWRAIGLTVFQVAPGNF